MPSLRIVPDNAVDRSTLSASTTAGVLAVSNLKSDKKSEVYRATGTSTTITGNLTGTESASVLHLLGNFSSTMTLRLRLYSGAAGTGLVLDTGAMLACTAAPRVPRGWTAAQAASAYANGGGAQAWLWFAPTDFKGYVIDIVDTANLQGYAEVAQAVLGKYWAPTNHAVSASLDIIDSTTTERTAAGDQVANAGTVYRKLSIDLKGMPPADRATLVNLLMNSRAYPILISAFAESGDAVRERDHMFYGRRASDSSVSPEFLFRYASSVDFEEV
ncbi:MAG TPA: hypothetical protein VGC21_13635 [Telluria sp.]|jgi:hypothetical protein